MMQESFVAFIDVLGFSEMVSRDCLSPRQDYIGLTNLLDVMAKIEEVVGTGGGIGYTQFSDAIVLHAPFRREGFDNFILLCQTLQKLLFSKQILCRGGIAVGRHFSENNFIFSEGLIEAYRLESTAARVPRIIVSRNLLDLIAYPNTKYSTKHLVLDKDNEYFIDYLVDAPDEDLQSFIQKINSTFSEAASISVREKYLWTAAYINYLHPHLNLRMPDFSR